MNVKIIAKSVLVISVFLMSFYSKRIVLYFFEVADFENVANLFLFYSLLIVPPFLATILLFGLPNSGSSLGLNKGVVKGFWLSVVAVLPMFISSGLLGKWAHQLSLLELIKSTLLAGFVEEFLFRGFLFGILFRKLKWGFIPASLLAALIFGLGHVYQGTSFHQSLAIFIITAMGSMWFAWLYIEWDNNLWIPIFLHTLMNLSWTLFSVSENAMGGASVNLFRAITIALTIFYTIRKNKKSGLKISKYNLFLNS